MLQKHFFTHLPRIVIMVFERPVKTPGGVVKERVNDSSPSGMRSLVIRTEKHSIDESVAITTVPGMEALSKSGREGYRNSILTNTNNHSYTHCKID